MASIILEIKELAQDCVQVLSNCSAEKFNVETHCKSLIQIAYQFTGPHGHFDRQTAIEAVNRTNTSVDLGIFDKKSGIFGLISKIKAKYAQSEILLQVDNIRSDFVSYEKYIHRFLSDFEKLKKRKHGKLKILRKLLSSLLSYSVFFRDKVVLPFDNLLSEIENTDLKIKGQERDLFEKCRKKHDYYQGDDFSSRVNSLRRGVRAYERIISSFKKHRKGLEERYGHVPRHLELYYEEYSKKYEILKGECEFMERFSRAYFSDNQQEMSDLAKGQVHGSFECIGSKTTYMAFAGVVPRQHMPGRTSWEGSPEKKIPPRQYAERLKNIFINGYRPSARKLPGSFHGISEIRNVFFYLDWHMHYGACHALVGFSLYPYCLFMARGNEGVIFTTKNIPPGRITLFVRPPDMLKGNEQLYQKSLIHYLDKMNVKYSVRIYN